MSSRASIKLWSQLPLEKKISTYKQTKYRTTKMYMLGQLSTRKYRHENPSELSEFFEAIHDSSCVHDTPESCVASPMQREAFDLMTFTQQTILANDRYLFWRKGWSELIESIPNIYTKARIIIEIRHEGVRRWVLKGMDPKELNEVLSEIRREYRRGYHHPEDEEQWYRVATNDYHPVCDICRNGYKIGAYILVKTCGEHTTHMKCATNAWGKYRKSWRERPCQLCAGTKMSAEEWDAKVDAEVSRMFHTKPKRA